MLELNRNYSIKQIGDLKDFVTVAYVLCADICNLKLINDTYGYAAGDLIIAETARCIEKRK